MKQRLSITFNAASHMRNSVINRGLDILNIGNLINARKLLIISILLAAGFSIVID